MHSFRDSAPERAPNGLTSLHMASTSLSLISCIPAGTADGSHTEVAMFDVALMAEASPAVDVASPSFVSLTSSTALSLVLSATVPLGNDTAVEIIKALSCGAPVLTDKSGLWLDRPDDHARAAALTLLEHTHFEVLCRCTQQTEDDKRVFRGYYGSGSETAKETATATLVALRWPSGQRAFCCFVENKVDSPLHHLGTRFSAHLYVINEKKKPQAVTMLMMQIYPKGAVILERFAERTNAGMQSLRRLLRSVSVPGKPCWSLPLHLDDQQLTTLLIGAAEAKAGLVPLDDAAALRRQLLVHASMLKNPPAGSFGGEGQKNPAVSIGSGVALLNWEPLAMPVAAAATGAAAAASDATASDGFAAGAAGSAAGSKAASKKKAISEKPTTSPATLQLLQALTVFAPRDEQAQRKHTFKMAKLADVEAGGSAHATGWGGDCGLFHELGVEVLLKVLEHCPLHSRLVLTEFTNKSFRMMRLEPELFSTLRLHHFDSVKLTAQLARATAKWSKSSTDVIFCPASHFAILLQAKKNVVRHLSFTGGDTPLTAIKASIKLVGARLASLSLRGEANVNALTLTEVGKHCTNLTYLDLNCGKSLGADRSAQSKDEQALIAAVRGMKGLKTLRLPPFQIMSTFIGDWGFVKGAMAYKHPEIEEEHLEERVSVDDHDFMDGTEGNLTFMDASFDNAEGAHGRCKFHSYPTYLRQLQGVLPRGCKLTNNGRWAAGGFMTSSWGTPTVEGAAEWNIFGANSYKQLSGSTTVHILGLGRTVEGSDGSTIVNGLVKTVYLQCGDPADRLADGIEPKRFSTSLGAWQAANPEPKEEPKPLGAVIET